MSALIKPALGPADLWQGSESANKWPWAPRSRGPGRPQTDAGWFFLPASCVPPTPPPFELASEYHERWRRSKAEGSAAAGAGVDIISIQ